MKLKTLAIPIRCVDYSNTSQIISMFSREEGLLEGIAKGAHRPRNSFQGPFDLAVIYDVVYLKRRTPGLSIIAEAEVVDGWRGLRSCWKRHILASQLVEFLRGVSLPADRTPALFDLAAKTLTLFSAAPPRQPSVVYAAFRDSRFTSARFPRGFGFLRHLRAAVAGRAAPGVF